MGESLGDEYRLDIQVTTKLKGCCANQHFLVSRFKRIGSCFINPLLQVTTVRLPNMGCAFVVFCVLVLLLEHSHFTMGSHCESVKIPLCRNMPYNRTRMPNLMHHSTQENAILAVEQYEVLAKTSCSEMIVFYLCSLYAPICTGMDFQTDAVPPCRSVCERVKTDCEPLLNRYNVSWPEAFDCSELPQYDRGVCITPDAIVADGTGPGLSTKAATNIKSGESFCRCHPVAVPTRKLYVAKRFDYAIKAKVKTVEVIGELTIAQVMVMQVLKSSRVPVWPRAMSLLWTVSGCACPTLTSNTLYLIMGHDDPGNNRLLFDERAIAVPWKKGFAKKVHKWEQHLLKRQKTKDKASNGKSKASENANQDKGSNGKDGTNAKKRQRQRPTVAPTARPGVTTVRPNRRKNKPSNDKT